MDDEEIKNILERHEERIKKIEEYLADKPKEEIVKKLSVREFLLEKKPSSDVQCTLLFGYYLEKFKDKEEFSTEEIKECFREAKEAIPKNPSDKIYKCIRKGWMATGKQPKTATLTNLGIKSVEEGFKDG